jgi:hypothetical protein
MATHFSLLIREERGQASISWSDSSDEASKLREEEAAESEGGEI